MKLKRASLGISFLVHAVVLLCFPAVVFSETYPQRIISLGPRITEKIYLLEAGDRIIANTIYCQNPPEAAKKQKVGAVIEVNLEKIVSLRPDIVLATSLTDLRARKKLKNLGIRVVSFPLPKNFNEICEQFLELSRIIGKEEKAKEIIKTAKRKVDSIHVRFKGMSKPKVFIQVGTKPLFTVTKDSFVNDFIELAGGVNIARDMAVGIYSREKVIKQNPDVIIITTMGIIGDEEKKIWQGYKTLNAVKNNRIYIIDASKIGSPTPVNFVKTLEEIAEMLHPEWKSK